MRFKDKSVVITGGGGKIAKAYAMAFAKEGAKLSLPDIASAEQIVKTIKDLGGTAISMACDVSNEQSVKAMVAETVKQFGTVDILINNAAYFMSRLERAVLGDDRRRIRQSHGGQRARLLALRQSCRHHTCMKQKSGKIINISSNVALTGNPKLHPLRHVKRRAHRHDSRHGEGAGRLEHLRQLGESRLRRHRRPPGRSQNTKRFAPSSAA